MWKYFPGIFHFFKGHDNGQNQKYCTVCILCQQHSTTLNRLSTPYPIVKKLCNCIEQKLMMFFEKHGKYPKDHLASPAVRGRLTRPFSWYTKSQKGTFPFSWYLSTFHTFHLSGIVDSSRSRVSFPSGVCYLLPLIQVVLPVDSLHHRRIY